VLSPFPRELSSANLDTPSLGSCPFWLGKGNTRLGGASCVSRRSANWSGTVFTEQGRGSQLVYTIKTENFDQISVLSPLGRTLFSALLDTPFFRSCRNCVGKPGGASPLAAAFSSFSLRCGPLSCLRLRGVHCSEELLAHVRYSGQSRW